MIYRPTTEHFFRTRTATHELRAVIYLPFLQLRRRVRQQDEKLAEVLGQEELPLGDFHGLLVRLQVDRVPAELAGRHRIHHLG